MRREENRKQKQQPKSQGSSGSSSIPPPAISPKRKWLFRLLAIVVPSLILLGGVELLLRVLGFGFDPHFFKRETIGGKEYYVANDDFGRRFFPRSLARIPEPVLMPVKKTPGVFRIFIFGESAALGDPRPNFGAGCYLQVLLTERFPRTKFEVVNTSMTAINSNVILPISRECARHDGDLWLIYMGNNEMVGPFGAATVFGARAPPLWLIRAQTQLRRLRLGQLLYTLGQKLHHANSTAEGWQGMEMFTQNRVVPNDPRRERVYRTFERNLNDILNAGLGSGARILLSTVAVNLKDCPPFGTLSGNDLPAADRSSYEKFCQEGATAESQGNFAGASSDFQRAAEVCPQSAEAQFQLATCLLRLTNEPAARIHFQKAVDDDALPFRADSQINGAIRIAAHRFPGKSLDLCDAAADLEAASPDGIPGGNFLYEHVHLNPEGNYALALAWAAKIEGMLAPALKRDARPSWDSQTECDQLLGLTDWNRISILRDILRRIQRPPFSGRSGNAKRMADLQSKIDELERQLTDKASEQARIVYLSALSRAPENFRLHENYAEFLEDRKELPSAIAERRKVCELLPCYYFPWYALGTLLKDAGALGDAREALLKAADLKPDQGDVRLELGTVFARQGDWERAQRELNLARRFSPGDPQVPLFLGEVLWMLGRHEEAVTSLHEAIQLAPSDWQPHYRLASDLARLGKLSEAAAEYQESLRLNPASVRTKLGLAAVLMDLGHKPEAVQQLTEILKLDPTNQTAFDFLKKIRGM